MKDFGKGLLVILGVIVAVPIMIIVLAALFGFGALVAAIPDVMFGVIGVLLLVSIPGLICGLIIGHHKK